MLGPLRRWWHRRETGHDPEWIRLYLTDDPRAIPVRVCRTCWVRSAYAE